MKTWIKRSLIGLFGVGIVLGGMSACSHRHEHHGMAMDGEHMARMQGKFIERATEELDLTAVQQQHLAKVGDRFRAQRSALIGSTTDPRAEMQALVAGPRFDRARALAIVEEKTEALRSRGPDLVIAVADFYDSLDPAQQQKLREHAPLRRHRWFQRD